MAFWLLGRQSTAVQQTYQDTESMEHPDGQQAEEDGRDYQDQEEPTGGREIQEHGASM